MMMIKTSMRGGGKGEEGDIDRLPLDLLAHMFTLITCFKDLAQASSVCRKWRQGVKESMGRKEKLSFAGWKMDDESTSRLVSLAYSLKDLDISRSRWGCQITDHGLYQMSMAKCISNLSSISLWGTTGITDYGVMHLISKATSLQHLNIGGTFITDVTLFSIADSCPHLKTIVLWGCRHVTEDGLLQLVNKCRNLKSINAWGMRVPLTASSAYSQSVQPYKFNPKECFQMLESILLLFSESPFLCLAAIMFVQIFSFICYIYSYIMSPKA